VNPTLQGYAAAVLESVDTDERHAVAHDLEAFERLVMGNAPLRAALTDTTVRGPARRAVVNELLDGKVSLPARRIAAYAVSVVHAPDVVTALGWAANRSRRLAEGQDESESPLSLSQARQRVGGFATALNEELSNEELEEMEDELFRFARIVESTHALRSALVDRDLAVEARQALVTQILEGKILPATLTLVRYAISGGRARDIVGTLDWLSEQTAKARGWRIARVRAAAPVEDAQRVELAETLQALTGSPVDLQVVIDPTLLSGALIQIGDLQVDATARGRIDNLREHMVPSAWDRSDRGDRAHAANATGTTTTQTEGAS